MNSQTVRTLILIDGDNVLYSAKHVGISIDFRRLRELLEGEFGTVTRLSYYGSAHPVNQDQIKFTSELNSLGYDVHLLDSRKAQADIQMVTDAMSLSASYDRLALLSGDRDFAYLLVALKKKGKKTVVVGFPVVTGRSLRDSADEYVNLEDLLAAGAATVAQSSKNSVTAITDLDTFYFKKGIHFESYVIVRELFLSAKRSLTIIDRYINDEILYLLAVLAPTIKVRIITLKIGGKDFTVLLSKLIKENRKIDVYKSNLFHDRFIRIDDAWWHLGHSIKDLGSADAMLARVRESSILSVLSEREDEVIKTSLVV
jgi:uncharacterized LabA/DUF88 family protein